MGEIRVEKNRGRSRPKKNYTEVIRRDIRSKIKAQLGLNLERKYTSKTYMV